jgi:uncharacterized protein (UPF0248 family)
VPARTLRDLLNRLRWDVAAPSADVVLDARVRASGEETVEVVRFDEVVEILPAGVTVADGTFLPYHRLLEVRRGSQVLWRKPSEEGERDA